MIFDIVLLFNAIYYKHNLFFYFITSIISTMQWMSSQNKNLLTILSILWCLKSSGVVPNFLFTKVTQGYHGFPMTCHGRFNPCHGHGGLGATDLTLQNSELHQGPLLLRQYLQNGSVMTGDLVVAVACWLYTMIGGGGVGR